MSIIGLILITIGFLKILFSVNLNDFKYCPNACAYRLQIKQIFNQLYNLIIWDSVIEIIGGLFIFFFFI